jgi:hypothetical protein
LKKTLALKQLKFKISEWNSLGDEGLGKFGEGIACLSNLKILSIHFG